ncbi:MAG: ACP S-malonyltransferase [Alphaproteobacteria bacterium]
MTNNCFVFPGQGSQVVGMGKELAENFKSAQDVFNEVNDALSFDLFKLMIEGPAEELNMTVNTQPALMATSMAVVNVLKKEFDYDVLTNASFLAGHSLGEYSACCAAGVFSLTDTAKLLKIRGEAMQAAEAGAMAAILGLDIEKVSQLAKESGVYVANDNCPGQIVISGIVEGIDKAVALASEFGAKRAIKLPVSGAFHSPLMQNAQQKMGVALTEVSSNNPSLPIISNVVASAVDNKEEIIKNLTLQVTGSVRWRESVAYMAQNNITNIIELGSGKVLSGLVKKCDATINTSSVGTPADIENFIKENK